LTALDASYYDDTVPIHTLETVGDHPLAPLWEAVSSAVKNDDVYDLGCGPGPLALTLWLREYKGEYRGYDFSPVCVDAARFATGGCDEGTAHSFEVADLRDDPPYKDEPVRGNAWFVFVEVLEHLDDDHGALRRWVPPGGKVLMSLPNYASESHVRHFASPGDVYARYAALLRFRAWRMFDLSPPEGRAVHLFEAVMREDVWDA